MKVDLHQGSVLSSLFAFASSEVRSGLPSELLCAADLVSRAPAMEQLGRCICALHGDLAFLTND